MRRSEGETWKWRKDKGVRFPRQIGILQRRINFRHTAQADKSASFQQVSGVRGEKDWSDGLRLVEPKPRKEWWRFGVVG